MANEVGFSLSNLYISFSKIPDDFIARAIGALLPGIAIGIIGSARMHSIKNSSLDREIDSTKENNILFNAHENLWVKPFIYGLLLIIAVFFALNIKNNEKNIDKFQKYPSSKQEIKNFEQSKITTETNSSPEYSKIDWDRSEKVAFEAFKKEGFDYKSNPSLLAAYNVNLKALGNDPANENRDAEWFLFNAHKLTKNDLGQSDAETNARTAWDKAEKAAFEAFKKEGFDYKSKPSLLAAYNVNLKALGNDPANENRDAEWFLLNAHKLTKNDLSALMK